MFSEFFGIELGKRALITQQTALDTTAHNIANANTPGYSRQTVELATTTPLVMPDANRAQMPGQLGTGVKVADIERARDQFLEKQVQSETSTQSALQSQGDYFSRIESLVNEPSSQSIGQALNDFWASWQDLSANPEDAAVRSSVVSTAQRLTYQLQNKDSELQGLQQNADQQIRTQVDRINQIAGQLRDINIRINQSVGIDTQPNDLMDTRDKLLGELSALTDFQGHPMANGLYDITIGGHTLVQDQVFIPMTVTDDPANNNYAAITWSDDNTPALINNGSIQGLTQIRDTSAPAYRQSLNDLALGLMAAVNPLQANGYALNAAAPSGQNFFTGTGVQDIQVNPTLLADPSQLAAASNANAPGDGSNALALAQLQSALTMAGNSQTFGGFYQNWVAQVGLDGQHNQESQDAQKKLVDSLTQQQNSISGVNTDEEMTNVIKYQNGYAAAARIISTMDSMLDTIINHMGAGR